MGPNQSLSNKAMVTRTHLTMVSMTSALSCSSAQNQPQSYTVTQLSVGSLYTVPYTAECGKSRLLALSPNSQACHFGQNLTLYLIARPRSTGGRMSHLAGE